MKTILLTGGLGYIGSHIAVQLLNSNESYNVIIIDNLSNCNIRKLSIIKDNRINNNNCLVFLKMDMLNYEKLEKIFQTNKIDIVIHLAGLKSVGESTVNPILYYNNNIKITLNLLKIMKNNSCKNIIFSSSATVYGSSKAPYNENSQIGVGLTNPYGKTKYMQEEILRDLYTSDNSWNIIILRYFNPVSQLNKSMKEEPSGIPNNLFPYIVKVHKKQLSILQIYGNDYNTLDGTCERDFIHVVDLADGHIKACNYIINNNNIEIKTYNLGTGNPISVKYLISKFEEINKATINYEYVARREGDLAISYADSSLALKELGWKTKYTIDDMVKY
tara:strand:+ start:85 stop:1080 length:996 start_codon:yes stop_codon:yes gene_type:complete